MVNDTCAVGLIKAGTNYDPHWEVFNTGDVDAAREMWCKLHGGDVDDDHLHAYAYNGDNLARSYGIT